MIKIAITGNIASGKSEAEKILSEKGFKVMDTDKAAHKILNASLAVKEEFKSYDVFENGEISRQKLGELVFSDKKQLKKLENIIHPLVKEQIQEFFEKNSNEKYVFVSVPQLFEAGMETMFDKIIFISAKDNIRLERLMKRSGCTLDYARKRLSAQMPQNDKIQKSDFVINNDYSIADLEKQLASILKQV